MKKSFFVFILAFIFNLAWENLHSIFYANYRGGEITEFILVRAAFGDAVVIFVLIFVFRLVPKLKQHSWLIILAGVIISVAIEKLALAAGRWQYKDIMPIIPFLNIGLTPTIQLALTGYLVYRIVFRKYVH